MLRMYKIKREGLHGNQQAVEDVIARCRKDNGKAIRKDAVMVCDFRVTLFATLKKHTLTSMFFKSVKDWFTLRYGPEVIAYAYPLRREGKEYMHIGVVPITADGRLCAKERFNRSEMRDMWADFFHTFGQQYELQRASLAEALEADKEVQKVQGEADKVRRELAAARSRIEALEADKEVQKVQGEADKEALRLVQERLGDAYQVFARTIMRVNFLRYGDPHLGFVIENITDKQNELLDGICTDAANHARKNGFAKMANKMAYKGPIEGMTLYQLLPTVPMIHHTAPVTDEQTK